MLLVIIFSFFVRLSYFNDIYDGTGIEGVGKISSDEITYFSHSQMLGEKGFLGYIYNQKSVEVPLFHTFCLSVLYDALGDIEYVRIVNVFVSVASLWLLYKISSLMFGFKVGIFSLILSSFNLDYVAYSSSLLTESLYIFLLFLFLYVFLLEFDSEFFSIRSVLSILFLVLAALTRSIAFLLPLYLLFVVFFYKLLCKSRCVDFCQKNVLILVASLLFIMSVVAKNAIMYNLPSISTGSGAALWLGCRLDTEGDEPFFRGLSYHGGKKIASGGDKTKMVRGVHLTIEGDRRLKEEGIRIMKNNFFTVFLNDVKKIRRLLTGTALSWFYPYKDFYEWKDRNTRRFVFFTLSSIALFSFISVFGLIQMVREVVTHDNRVAVFCHSIWYFILISLPFLVNMRYGLPIILLLSIMASKLFIDLVDYRRWWSIGISFSAVLISIFSVISGTGFD